MDNMLAAEFFIIVAIITGDEVVKKGRVPLPSRYFWSGVAFAMLGLASPFITTKLANTLGAGVVLAILFTLFSGETAAQGNEGNKPNTTEVPATPNRNA